MDILDGMPLLGIKPYASEFDAPEAERTGWLAGKAEKVHAARVDERFK